MTEKVADRAKLFWSGRSQAVRLPKAFRFEGKEVRIHREGDKVILEPANTDEDPWAWLDKMPGELDEDFVKALEEEPEPYDESKADDLFK